MCPENIHITDNGIIPLKERVADTYFDPIRRVASKMSGELKKPKAKLPVLPPDPHPTEEPKGGGGGKEGERERQPPARRRGMGFELKRLPHASLDAAIAKAEHYRDLNQPEEAESICRDVIDIDAAYARAWKLLGLALTDRFASGRVGLLEEAIQAFERLPDGVRAHLSHRGRVGASGQGPRGA